MKKRKLFHYHTISSLLEESQISRHVIVALISMMTALPLRAETDVEFSGTLVSTPCRVQVGDEGLTVDFGELAAKNIMDNGQTEPVLFHIQLSECDLSLGSQVFVKFNGENVATNSALFAVTGGASGIGLSLTDSEGNTVIPGDEQKPVPLSAGTNQLTWLASIQATNEGPVQPGEFYSIVEFVMRYE
ncbi:type 1 fimbrial protein [Enterobacter sp. Cy-643]|uniref:fimbrial protein n=1 Tax=Enterobacter sp. Cy-643 TaxID=2608346 RepID=UPI00141DDBE3|nr:fimbrial protein [Enterobacter sp. Cy-643]NIF33017.1 type 1 fimbrial protein [Enterobacter sp. Cy-643]